MPYEKRLTTLARANRKALTPAENLLWQKVLRSRQFLGHKFHRQKPIGPYVVDFYCAELKLVIEVDGDSHAEQPGYDAQRYANRDILNNLPSVFEHLQTQLETP